MPSCVAIPAVAGALVPLGALDDVPGGDLSVARLLAILRLAWCDPSLGQREVAVARFPHCDAIFAAHRRAGSDGRRQLPVSITPDFAMLSPSGQGKGPSERA